MKKILLILTAFATICFGTSVKERRIFVKGMINFEDVKFDPKNTWVKIGNLLVGSQYFDFTTGQEIDAEKAETYFSEKRFCKTISTK